MLAVILQILSYVPQVPALINTVEELIKRGKASGDLSAAEADALTALSVVVFAKYGQPAPPPPGA